MRIARLPHVRRAPAVLLLFLTLASGAWAQGSSSPKAHSPRPTGHPLLPGIWRLDGYDPALPAADLRPLQGIVGKATVVGLGESVHTSGGFHEMKDRTIRFLVQSLGFRVVAIESPWIDADRVAAYVQTCEGTPEDALKGLLGVWQSAEIRDLVQWMCEWNHSHPKPKDRLSFFGFDIEQPQNDNPALTAFLARTGVPADSPWIAALAACAGQNALNVGVSDVSYGQCTEGLRQIDAYFQQNAATIVQQTSQQDFEIAKLNLIGLRAWEDESYYYVSDGVKSKEARDQAMAYAFNVLRGLRFPNARTVVWAHNFHLAKRPVSGEVTMGSYLAQGLGKSYVDLALVAHETDIDWIGVGCGPFIPPFPNSVESLLYTLGEPALLVDLAFPGAQAPFIPSGLRGLGNLVVDPPQLYDGVLYLDVSPKMTPLAWPSCQ